MASVLRFADATLRIVVDRGLCVARWADSPAPHHFPHVVTAVKAAADGPGRAALFNVVDAKGKIPRFNDEVRQAAGRMAIAITPISAGTAHVLLIDGFTGAAVRMFLSTLTLLTRSGPPTTVHSTLAAGAAWLANQAGTGITVPQIETAYAHAERS
jgi:hypothetical protein